MSFRIVNLRQTEQWRSEKYEFGLNFFPNLY